MGQTEDDFLAALPPALDLYGARSDSGSRSYTPRDATKRIREEIALAIKAGVLPAGIKVGVRNVDYKSIHVDITAWSGSVFVDAYVAHVMDPKTAWDDAGIRDYDRERYGYRFFDGYRPEYTVPLNDALHLLDRLGSRHNYNNSDLQTDYFDVGYYLHVGADPIASEARQAIRLESDPAMRALMNKAVVAARAVGKSVVESVCGKGGVNRASEWSLKSLISVAERNRCILTDADGNVTVNPACPVLFYDKRRRRWVPGDEHKVAV